MRSSDNSKILAGRSFSWPGGAVAGRLKRESLLRSIVLIGYLFALGLAGGAQAGNFQGAGSYTSIKTGIAAGIGCCGSQVYYWGALNGLGHLVMVSSSTKTWTIANSDTAGNYTIHNDTDNVCMRANPGDDYTVGTAGACPTNDTTYQFQIVDGAVAGSVEFLSVSEAGKRQCTDGSGADIWTRTSASGCYNNAPSQYYDWILGGYTPKPDHIQLSQADSSTVSADNSTTKTITVTSCSNSSGSACSVLTADTQTITISNGGVGTLSATSVTLVNGQATFTVKSSALGAAKLTATATRASNAYTCTRGGTTGAQTAGATTNADCQVNFASNHILLSQADGSSVAPDGVATKTVTVSSCSNASTSACSVLTGDTQAVSLSNSGVGTLSAASVTLVNGQASFTVKSGSSGAAKLSATATSAVNGYTCSLAGASGSQSAGATTNTDCQVSFATSGPNHYRFEFSSASVQTGTAVGVTIKACTEASTGVGTNSPCTAYGSATTLTPAISGSGSWSGLSAAPTTTFTGSSAGITVTDSVAESVTFSYSAPSVTPTDATLECYDTSTSKVVSCNSALTSTWGALANFVAVEHGTGWTGNQQIYTKLAGVAFPNSGIDLMFGRSNSTLTGYAGTPTVDIVDYASSGSCGSRTVLQTLGNTAFVNGARTIQPTATFAAASAQIRIVDSSLSLTYCSDRFSIRPTEFSLALSNAGDPLVAGQSGDTGATSFSLTATARYGWNGSTSTANVTTVNGVNNYNGTPTPDWTKANDWLGNALTSALFTGSFGAGNGVSATGSFYYDDFGLVDLNRANTVSDSSFTAVSNDQSNGDCVSGSTSNTENASHMYGCNVPSATPSPTATNRFRPASYAGGSNVTSSCGGFTYVGQNFGGGSVTLTAKSAHGTTMQRLSGTALSTTAPVYAPAYLLSTWNYDASGVTATAASDASFTPASLPTSTANSTWSAGVYSVSPASYAISRASRIGPYDRFFIAVKVTDNDQVRISSCTDNNSVNGTIASSGNDSTCKPPVSGSTKLRFGMLKLENAYGSEALPLYLPIRALYWNGTGWAKNSLDNNCTAINISGGSTNIAIGNYMGASTLKSNLSVSPTNANPLKLTSGEASLMFSASGIGNTGSADVAFNLSTVAANSANLCLTWGSGASAPNSTSAGNMSYLQGNWCSTSYNKDPSARITFGAAKSQFFYRREKY